jgi:molybdopterin molybdotransferase
MTSPAETLQRITILTPLAELVSRLDALVSPVAATMCGPERAVGAILAADVVAPDDLPRAPSALLDGWAVAAEQTDAASAYAPVVPATNPVWVNAGDRLPSAADAVLPADAMTITNGQAEIIAAVAPGEGVLPASFDIRKGMVLRRAGERVRENESAVFRALGIGTISVRAPRVKILSVSQPTPQADMISPAIAHAVRVRGSIAEVATDKTLEAVLSAKDCDAIITIGRTGGGKNDAAIKSLARIGKVECHGIGISPGQTTAFGNVSGCPALMLPGRLDAALAAFLIVGSKLLSRLAVTGETASEPTVALTKKVTSTIGLAEVVFVRRVAGGLEPLGSGTFPLQALAQADGWILIPSESEGLAAGSVVEMRNLS